MSVSTFNSSDERILVSMMMQYPQKCIDYSAGRIQASDFFDPDAAELFDIVVKRHRQNEPTDPHTLVAEFKSKIGDHAARYLAELIPMGVAYWHTAYYVKRIIDSAMVRQIKDVANSVGSSTQGPALSAVDLLTTTRTRLDSIARQNDEGVSTAYEAGIEFLDENDRFSDEGSIVEFGIASLDQRLGGLQKGELIVPAGRPGTGKSVLGLQACRHTCAAGGASLYVSLEMSRAELTNRLLAGVCSINASKIRSRKMSVEESREYREGLKRIENWRLVISDTPGLNIEDIRQQARKMKSRRGLDLLVVDYISLIRPLNKRMEKRDQVGEVTQSLKELAKELSIPVVAMCQLNREADKVTPKLSNLSDSSSVEKDADIVLFSHRPEADKNEFSLIIAKHRHGRPGLVDVVLDTKKLIFKQPNQYDDFGGF